MANYIKKTIVVIVIVIGIAIFVSPILSRKSTPEKNAVKLTLVFDDSFHKKISVRNAAKTTQLFDYSKQDISILRFAGFSQTKKGVVAEVNKLTSDLTNRRYCIISQNGIEYIKHLPDDDPEIFKDECFISASIKNGALLFNRFDVNDGLISSVRIKIPEQRIVNIDGFDANDNNDLVFSVSLENVKDYRIYLYNSKERKITHITTGIRPIFSNSGNAVAFYEGKDAVGLVHIYNLKTQHTKDLRVWQPSTMMDVVSPPFYWKKPYGNGHIQISPDNKWIVSSMMYSHVTSKVMAKDTSDNYIYWEILATVGPSSWLIVPDTDCILDNKPNQSQAVPRRLKQDRK